MLGDSLVWVCWAALDLGSICGELPAWGHISVIVKAPWNTNIFNRMVFLLEKKPVAHPQQVCDRERYWNHPAFMDWVSEEKSLLLSAVLEAIISIMHNCYLFPFLPPFPAVFS